MRVVRAQSKKCHLIKYSRSCHVIVRGGGFFLTNCSHDSFLLSPHSPKQNWPYQIIFACVGVVVSVIIGLTFNQGCTRTQLV